MRRLLLLAGVCLLVVACSTSSSAPGFALDEFSISGPENLPTGTQKLMVANSGELPHTLVVTDATGGVVAATDVIPPGEESAIQLTLEEGRYSFTCRIVAQNDEGGLVDHFEAGMSAMVEVG